MNILIIEDEQIIRNVLTELLTLNKFTVTPISTIEELDELNINTFDVVLIDINLNQDYDGFDIYRYIKDIKDIPSIFLTANDSETSIIKGLELGAEDYITKPFKSRELILRIKNILKRNNINSVIKFGPLTIDKNKKEVLKNNKQIELTPIEYNLLTYIIDNKNKVITREIILDKFADKDSFINDNTISVYIKRLREKIEDDNKEPKIILTVRGIGYKAGNYEK